MAQRTMTPGRMVWLTRHFFRHGVRGAYGREIVARRVQRCRPLTGLVDRRAEVHVLTSKQDWLPLIWTLRTFYRTTERAYRLCIHEDGSLPPHGRAELQRQFPDARIIARADADRRLAAALAATPRCATQRAKNNLLLKTFDFPAFLDAERLIVLDCDLLFFHSPTAFLARVENARGNSFNRDWSYGYSVPWEEIEARAPRPIENLVNSGLGVLAPDAISYAWCEEYFALFPSLASHPHRIEQTLIGLCAARARYEMLPSEYDVHTGPSDFRRPVRHYSGPSRRLLFSEGIPHVWKHRARLLE